MKKILILVLMFLCLQGAVLANDEVSFIYINGSNNDNEKMKNWYMNGVKRLHPIIIKKFSKNSYIKRNPIFKKDLKIKDEPVIFFWGYKTKRSIEFVQNQLDISRAVTAIGGYTARKLISQSLHDAIWIIKDHNMESVLDDLNNTVKQEYAIGNTSILYGYSAGSFITYQYLLDRLRYINLLDLLIALKADEEIIQFAKDNPRKDTCVAALTKDYKGLGSFSSTGHLILDTNIDNLKENYLNIDSQTENVCAPENSIQGIVNFACPLALFYSDMADPDYEINYYGKLLSKYVYENGVFWISVNYKEDPLGFPSTNNLTIPQTEEKLEIEINNPSGVIYDNSSVWSFRPFPIAHLSYWSARQIFSQAVVKSFVDGYKFHYDEAFQKKILKQQKYMLKKHNN